MRHLASLPDEDQATRFGDYLLSIGIDNTVEEGASGWSIWVKDDDKVEAAKRELEQFTANPADPRYGAAARNAERIRREEEKRARKLQKNYVDVRTQWSRSAGAFKAVTMAVIAMSVLVGLMTMFGRSTDRLTGLRITARDVEPEVIIIPPLVGMYFPLSELTEIGHGQVWRLITPIFIHYGIFHLLFNMFWLRDLGTMIEGQKGSLWLAILIVVVGIPSNIAQYIMAGPWFGGMSGVVYGLFGYVWMKGKFSPHEGMQLHPNTVFVMIAWFVLCFTGWVGPIANTAHAVGLLMGMLFGSARYLRRKVFS